eukprot:3934220-Rhodomonas_salina.1
MKSQINDDYDYIVSVSPWLQTHTHIDPSDYTTVMLRLNVTQSEPDSELGPAVDSASPLDIQTDPMYATLTAEPRVYLDCIIHCTTSVPQAICCFPMVNSNRNLIVLETKGQGILFPDARSRVVAL